MTLSQRNRIVRISLILCFAAALFFLFSLFYLSPGKSFSLGLMSARLENLSSFSSQPAYNTLFWSIVTAIVFFFFSTITSILLFHYFKKKISPEIFFFILFILSLSFQSVRMFQLQLILLDTSPVYGVIVTRIFYFFRLFGIACFFASSLFPIGVQFQKFGTILVVILLLSFSIAALIPIDSTSMNMRLLYSLSDKTTMLVMALSIRVLTIVNFIRVVLTKGSLSYLTVLIAALLIVTGDELLLILPVPIIPFLMILTGTFLYSRSLYNYYLWV